MILPRCSIKFSSLLLQAHVSTKSGTDLYLRLAEIYMHELRQTAARQQQQSLGKVNVLLLYSTTCQLHCLCMELFQFSNSYAGLFLQEESTKNISIHVYILASAVSQIFTKAFSVVGKDAFHIPSFYSFLIKAIPQLPLGRPIKSACIVHIAPVRSYCCCCICDALTASIYTFQSSYSI